MGRAASDTSLPMHWSPPLAPAGGEPSLADMMDWISRQCPTSGAEALRQLRQAFPDSPLTLRAAVLSKLIGRDSGYRPR